MTTCESCCREFKASRRSRDCPYCGFNNGGGWWPRTNDVAGRIAADQREKQIEKQRQAKERAARKPLSNQGVLVDA